MHIIFKHTQTPEYVPVSSPILLLCCKEITITAQNCLVDVYSEIDKWTSPVGTPYNPGCFAHQPPGNSIA